MFLYVALLTQFVIASMCTVDEEHQATTQPKDANKYNIRSLQLKLVQANKIIAALEKQLQRMKPISQLLTVFYLLHHA